MAAFQNVVLTDRASTPVNHTYVPAGWNQPGVAVFIEPASGGVPEGSSRLTASVRRTPSGNFKVALKLDVPVLVTEVVNSVSVNKVDSVDRAEVTFTFSGKSTTARRNNVVGMTESALKSAQVLLNDLIVGLNPAY